MEPDEEKLRWQFQFWVAWKQGFYDRWEVAGSLVGSRIVASLSGGCVSFTEERSWVEEQEEQIED